MEISILYSDKDIAVCLKPAGVQSEGGGMPLLLQRQLGAEEVFPVHRLDMAVGGVMVFALNRRAAASLSSQAERRTLKKKYLAAVSGRPEEDSGRLRDLLFRDRYKNKSYVVKRKRAGVREAELEYSLAETKNGRSLLEVRPITGRTHQIRVQFASRGMPLLGDVKYGSTERSCPVALFSAGIEFDHPGTGERMSFSALPGNTYPWSCFDCINKGGSV